MELADTKRAQIIALWEAGVAQVDIGKQLGESKQCVSYTIKRFKDTGSFKSKPRSGRPRVTSKNTDRLIRRASVKHPTASASSISNLLPAPVSTRTIQRRLHTEFNLKAYKAAKKPLLSAKNIRDRYTFCKRVENWTSEMWSRVLFSDETIIKQFANRGSAKVRRPPGKRYDPRYIIPTVKHSNSVMIWGSFSMSGRGNLWFLPANTTMNASNYLQLLKDNLQPMMGVRETTIFMHDGAPCHQAKTVKNWLESENIEVLGPWPGNSPDLNPIENLWTIVKDKVANQQPGSYADLIAAVQKVWCKEISPELCQKLVNSMPTRVKEVLKNHGKPIRY